MSTELINRAREGYQLTGFYGGDARGYCLQVTSDHGYVQLTREGAARLAADIFHYFLETPVPAEALCGGEGHTAPDRRVRSMTSSVGTTRDGYLVHQVIVECEDGTLWRLCDNDAGTDHWARLPAIPGR